MTEVLPVIARVALNVPTEADAFDYLVPNHLQSLVRPGSRVGVRLSGRKQTGYVIELTGCSAAKKLLEIEAVLEGEPAFDSRQLEVARWLSDYYLAPFGEVVKLLAPPGVADRVGKPKLIRVASLANGASADGLGPKQRRLIGLLSGGDTLPVPELLAEADAGHSSLKSLVDKGIITITTETLERRPDMSGTGGAHYPTLTDEQERAVGEIGAAISTREYGLFLLRGVTGSGKTEVYLRGIEQVLAQGRSAMVLIPEIALTPQTARRFVDRFGDTVTVLHSGLSMGERFDQWQAIKQGRSRIVVGTRSAVFAPLADVGLIVLDEEHETSYKQSHSPRYHAREVALYLASRQGAVVVLGSATPSLESQAMVDAGKATPLTLSRRVSNRPLPEVELVDMRSERIPGDYVVISNPLREAMAETLGAGRKVILLQNRRGFASFLLCYDCGFVPGCPRCAVSLTYHWNDRQLRCHHCDGTEVAPGTCPKCGSRELHYAGTGTQRVEKELAVLFPDITVVRMDRDTTGTRDAHRRQLSEFARADRAILLGTQMIAKGLDFPEVSLVGVISADTALNLPDFRAAERTVQLLMQVSGRSGRGEHPGRVMIQSFNPEHYAIRAAVAGDYEAFCRQEVDFRRPLDYPPAAHMINFGVTGPGERAVEERATALAADLRDALGDLAAVVGPSPAPITKLRGRYRWHVTLHTKRPDGVKSILRERQPQAGRSGGTTVVVDIDPLSLL